MFLLNNHIAAVSARMMTWEVTTSFDGTLTENELQKRFEEDFGNLFGMRNEENCDVCDTGVRANRVFFWPLVSFNASDGRKHRYLVAIANEHLANYRKKYDRCLPRQILFYAVADKILRGEAVDEVAIDIHANCNAKWNIADGNLLLVALWKKVLYILVFAKGRLCHWSEESGYGDCFDERIAGRVHRFKEFLKADELFVSAGSFAENFICCDVLSNMETLFRTAAKDPFWRGLDLDKSESLKPCEKRRWSAFASILLLLGLLVALFCSDALDWVNLWAFADGSNAEFSDVAPVELSSPAARDLEMLAWAEGHRDLFPAKWNLGRDGIADGANMFGTRRSRKSCDSLDYKLLGIVGGRVALMESVTGESKMLSVGDSLLKYRVKDIGKNEVVLRCGRKEVRYEIGTAVDPVVSQVGAR